MLATGCLKCLGRCCGVPCGPTEVRPKTARLERKPGIWAAYGLDLLANVLVIINYILTPDTLLSTAIAVVSVILYDLYAVDLSMNMNYSLITFGIIFPLTMSIQQAFTRRETALRSLVMFRSYAISVYSAHRCWDWPANGATVGGREGLPDDHCDNVRSLLTDIFKSVEAYCLLPRGGHARYYYTICGHHEFKELEALLNVNGFPLPIANELVFAKVEGKLQKDLQGTLWQVYDRCDKAGNKLEVMESGAEVSTELMDHR